MNNRGVVDKAKQKRCQLTGAVVFPRLGKTGVSLFQALEIVRRSKQVRGEFGDIGAHAFGQQQVRGTP